MKEALESIGKSLDELGVRYVLVAEKDRSAHVLTNCASLVDQAGLVEWARSQTQFQTMDQIHAARMLAVSQVAKE